jgi:hypothetical protein
VLYAHPESGRAFALLTNCSKLGVFDARLIEPVLESWGAAVDPLTPVEGTFDAAADEGSFENQVYRFDVVREGEQLLARMAARLDLYETDTARALIFQLQRVGEHLFQMSSNGVANPFPLAFVNPDATGKMQRLGAMARIFNRVS